MKIEDYKIKKNNKVFILNLLYFEEDDREIIKKIFNKWKDLNENLKTELKATRNVNFPEALSEALVCLDLNLGKLINIKGSNYSSSFDCYNKETSKRVQVKCSSSAAPSQFGPRSEQDIYYFIDFFSEKKIDGNYKIYEITNSQIDNTKVNKNETVKQKSKKSGQRPRFDIRRKLVLPLKLHPIFEGNLNN